MSVQIHFHAAFVPDTGLFHVQLKTDEQRLVEQMTPKQFIKFADSTEALVISGIKVVFGAADAAAGVEQQVRQYFRKVADAYRQSRRVAESGSGKMSMSPGAKVIKPNGDIIKVSPKNGKTFEYEELLALVECTYIETVRPPGSTGAIMVLDEEGKLNNKPLNPVASRIWQEGCDPGSPREEDPIVGTVLLCHESQLGE